MKDDIRIKNLYRYVLKKTNGTKLTQITVINNVWNEKYFSKKLLIAKYPRKQLNDLIPFKDENTIKKFNLNFNHLVIIKNTITNITITDKKNYSLLKNFKTLTFYTTKNKIMRNGIFSNYHNFGFYKYKNIIAIKLDAYIYLGKCHKSLDIETLFGKLYMQLYL